MRGLAAAVGQWVGAAALYLGFAGSAETAEIIAAAVTATFIVGFVFWCRHARATALRTQISWLHILPRVPRAVAIEAVVVGAALLRTLVRVPAQGEVLSQPFNPGDQSPRAAGRRAVAVLAASAAPDGYVLTIREDSLLLHRLVPRPTASDRRWPI